MALTKITTSLVAVNSLTSANIADNSIDATKIANNQILARHIAAGSISDQLAAAQPTITSLGTLTTLTVDDITLNNSTISDNTLLTISSGDDIVLDATSDIILDADGGDIRFKDGGTAIAKFSNSSSDFVITTDVDDKDIIFKGQDSTSEITALTLDMSDAGKATFNSGVVVGGDITKGSGEFKIKNTANGENVGIYTTSSSSELHALKIHSGGNVEVLNGNLVVGNASGATITMNDTDTSQEDFAFVLGANALAMRKGSNSNDIMRLDLTNERVGIGTTSPAMPLDVRGNVNITADDARLLIEEADGTDITWVGDITGAGVGGLFLYNHGGTATVQLRADNTAGFINNGANFGIGTDSPAELLHILGDSAKAQIESNGSDTGVQLVLDGAKTSNGAIGDIVFENAGDTVGMIRSNRASANDAADMLFYTQVAGGSNGEKMRITSTGRVGIHETAPEALLEVDGTIVHGNIREENAATRTYTNGSALNASTIEFDTSVSGSDEFNCVITWAKGTWSAFSYEFTFSAASWARKLAGGGYHNNSGGTISGAQIHDLYGLDQESDLSITGTDQTIVFTIQCPNGTHPHVHAKFMVGGSANAEASDFTVEWVAR